MKDKARNLILLIIMMSFATLAGCTTLTGDLGTEVDSVAKAGVTVVDVNPVVSESEHAKSMGTSYKAIFGKEYGGFSLLVDFDDQGRPKKLQVNASDVEAFAGQATAQHAAVAIREALTERDIQLGEAGMQIINDALMRLLVPAH